MFLNTKEKANKNKEKIIKKDTKRFKKLCITELNNSIKKGIDVAIVDFFNNSLAYQFEDEILNRAIKELREEHSDIDFSFSYRHYQNSYKGIQMIAI